MGRSVAIAGTPAVVAFDAVQEDSRCPDGAQCVWAGDAVVAVRVTTPAGGPHSGALHVDPERGPRALTASGYRLTFRALTPNPRVDTPIQPGDVRAELQLDAAP